jgi:amidase
MHGIPILIKNNIATNDKMNNTAGSFALLGAKVPRDSFVAQKLRDAGVIILGKSNLSQWANFRSTNSSNGWSAHGGQVLGAYIQNQDPSGSSSGSGVAASLGLAVACIGTETDGSIISPSMRNNLAGIKPSVGLTSRDLVIPISEHQDTIGPMARHVKDAAYLLQVIAGPDTNDNYTSAIPSGNLPDYVAACNENALSGKRIGIPDNVLELIAPFFDGNEVEVDAYFAAIPVLQDAGAVIVRNTNFTAVEQWIDSEAESSVLEADFISNLASYLSKLTENPNNIRTLADVRNFTRRFPAEEFPSRNMGTWDEALDVQRFNNTDPRFFPMLQEQLFLGGDGGVLGALETFNLDAVLLPSGLSSPFAAGVGSPVVTVPLGFYPQNATTLMNRRGNLVDTGPNVPFGLSFLGARFDEATVIGMAYAFEQKTKVRNTVRPRTVPRAEVGDFVAESRRDSQSSADGLAPSHFVLLAMSIGCLLLELW